MSLARMFWDLWCFEDLKEKDDSINQLMMEVFVEQPRLHQVCYYFIADMQNVKWATIMVSYNCHGLGKLFAQYG